jgi:hypothetical protein
MPGEVVSGSERIEVSAEELYALVSDVTRMAEWSPENTGARWLAGATRPEVGAKFSGSNSRGWRRWSTTCTVTAADPGRRFAFDVHFAIVPISSWEYDFSPEGDATLVTETWTDHRPSWFASGGRFVMGIADLRAHHDENIRRTLANLKAAAEQSG